jgi:hypothetical protein
MQTKTVPITQLWEVIPRVLMSMQSAFLVLFGKSVVMQVDIQGAAEVELHFTALTAIYCCVPIAEVT